MKLNIYEKKNGKKEVVKTYEAKEYDLMFGTMEELAGMIDIDSIKEITDAKIIQIVSKLMVNSLSTMKDLLTDIFDGLTEEELKKTKVIEIARVLVDVIIYTILQVQRSFSWAEEKKPKAADDR